MKNPRDNLTFSIKTARARLLSGQPVYADTFDDKRFRVLRIWSSAGAYLVEGMDGNGVVIERIKDLN